ncbi:MAG TPA: glycosyltransferase family 2 protein [Candidatus Polarisedimenticolia bacterium]|nr:glycosyltransferase family 2 protein [Candidatus Polarisedimenticolia bacterium]
MPEAPVLSIVLPVHDEAAVLKETIGRLRDVLAPLGRTFEILVVDDGSTDGSGAACAALAAQDPRLVLVTLTRRFGKEAALAAGLQAARGDAVVLMDADLQHPPDLLPEMVRRWDAGCDVVEAVRREGGPQGIPHRILARAFYALLGRAVGRDLQGATDFKLLDRQAVEALLACGERNRFFRGLVAWIGFTTAEVPFDPPGRHGGRSKWSFRDLLGYSVRSLLAFTSLPLRIVAGAGLVMVLLGALLAVQTLWNWSSGRAVSGFTTVILVELILGGLILTSLGVIAAYLALLYEEQKGRPLYLVRRPRDARPADRVDPRR